MTIAALVIAVETAVGIAVAATLAEVAVTLAEVAVIVGGGETAS